MPPKSHRPPCPECGYAVGTNRYDCPPCNRFISRVTRRTHKVLRTRHDDEFTSLQAAHERDVYAEMYPNHPWEVDV